ncbi:HAMP domain-containing sensor histidine kinase [Nocardioides sp. W7]|uniref:sensor histidine kinase n=1 Tax=Nocardioides sp. W7 TaxID=2931390 RepID=UPI001FD0F73D|nr:HAMP domain-containing sensor histidine kinase [Nocardioides sp. W7]
MLRPDGAPVLKGRLTVFALWQLPTLVLSGAAITGLSMTEGIDHPGRTLVIPAILMLLASVALFVLPWEQWGPSGRMIVPIIDVAAVVLMEFGAVTVLPSVSLLSILPMVWLGFEFAWAGVFAAVLGAVLVAGYSHLHVGDWPTETSAWLNVLLLPLVALVLVVIAQIVGDLLRSNREQLLERSEQLVTALQVSRDQATIAQGVVDTVDTAVWFYSADDQLRMSNEAADHLAGVAGGHMWNDDRTARIPVTEQIVPRALREELVPGHLEWWGPPGGQVALVVGARRVRRYDGTALGTVVAAWDVTDVVESLRVREEFLTTVSHELRTPLTSIMGYVEIIQDLAAPGSDLLPSLAVIERNAQTLLDRISNLLVANQDLAEDIKPTRQEIGPVVAGVVRRHLPTAAAAGVSLTATVPDGVTGRVDSSRFDQVVDNLTSNAIKYTAAGGVVEVDLIDQEIGFILTVTDSGRGMSDVERHQAFDRFYRSSGARKSATQGLGVGLSIVRDIVRAHGGEVALDPAPGGGTRATVTIPHHEPVGKAVPGRVRLGVS